MEIYSLRDAQRKGAWEAFERGWIVMEEEYKKNEK